LDPESTPGVFPFDGTIDAGNHAGATFQTACKFNAHLSFLIKRVKIGRTGIDTESFFTCLADFGIKYDMIFFIILESIEG